MFVKECIIENEAVARLEMAALQMIQPYYLYRSEQ